MTIFVTGLIIGVILFIVAVMALHTVVITEDENDRRVKCDECGEYGHSKEWCKYCYFWKGEGK